MGAVNYLQPNGGLQDAIPGKINPLAVMCRGSRQFRAFTHEARDGPGTRQYDSKYAIIAGGGQRRGFQRRRTGKGPAARI